MDIRSIRHAAGLSQSEIAAGLGFSQRSGRQTVSQLEARRDWLLSTIAAYVKAAGGSATLTVKVAGQTLHFPIV